MAELRIKGNIEALKVRVPSPAPRRRKTEPTLPGYGWVKTVTPTCEWCGWQPKQPYESLRRAQEGIQAHEANTKYGCRIARRAAQPTGSTTRTERDRIRTRALRNLARTAHSDRIEFKALDTYSKRHYR